MLRAQDFMTRKVNVIAPNESCTAAAEMMRRNHIRHLVVMADGRPVGVISAHDVSRNNWDDSVQDRMAENAVTTRPTATIREIANKMRGRSIGCLPVLNGRKLVGIVTTSDLLRLLGQGYQRPQPKGERPYLSRRLNSKR